jgi:hypothetical protein
MTVFHLPAEGPPLSTEQDALDVMGEAYGAGADLIAIPVVRFDPVVWSLSNKLLGHFVQKFVNYGLRLVIVGDISAYAARSKPLADFVTESNRRGRELRFVSDAADLGD